VPRDQLGFDAAFLKKPYDMAEMRELLAAIARDKVGGNLPA
jgi:hypothetical protein